MMKKVILGLFALVVSYSVVIANDDPPKKYNDGPYVILEEDSIFTYNIVEGKLESKSISSDSPLNVTISTSKKFDINPDLGWYKSPSTTYTTDQPIVAISDIHGQYDVFEHLLIANRVMNENLEWTLGKGNLVIVGDVMDRGDKVMESLWLIYHLEQQAEKAGGKVHFLLGNHELMVMNGHLDYLNKKYYYTSALLKRPYHTLFGTSTLLGKWLQSKNVILQLNDKVFVHGGLSQQAMSIGLTIDEINTTFRENIYYKQSEEIAAVPELSTLYFEDGPLWYRGYAYPYSFNKNGIDSLRTALDIEHVIVGHTTLPNIKGLYQNRIILIDSSIKMGKTGEVLHINGDKFFVGDMDGDKTPLISEERKLDERKPMFEHLNSQEDVYMVLSPTLEEIMNNFKKDSSSTQGQLTIAYGAEQLTFSANFKPGGKTRRKICSNPPIKIDLKKEELENFNFLPEYDKLKIVYQCKNSKSMEETIKMEKFIYNLHNVVTPYSHRAKLVNARMSDEKKFLTGLLLESREDLGLRDGIKEVEVKTIATEVLDRDVYVRMCLFQYMIANTDWSARKMHNSKLYQRIEDEAYLTIPYDFDYAGIINNEYAVTSDKLPISRVTQRYFMDKRMSLEELKSGIEYYLSIEDKIYQFCEEVDYLSDPTKNRVTKFIKGFYDIIKDDKKVARMIKK